MSVDGLLVVSSRYVLKMRTRQSQRSVGDSAARWTDNLRKVAGIKWMRAAQDMANWCAEREVYVLQ